MWPGRLLSAWLMSLLNKKKKSISNQTKQKNTTLGGITNQTTLIWKGSNLINLFHEKTQCLWNKWALVGRNQRYSFLFWKLLSLAYLSLTQFSTLGGKICNSTATEHGDLLLIHSCQSNRSNGVYTFLMSQSNGSFTLQIDCCRA